MTTLHSPEKKKPVRMSKEEPGEGDEEKGVHLQGPKG